MTAILVSFESGQSPLFPIGELVATPDAVAAIPAEEITAALARHASGDSGDVDEEDMRANKRALETGGRLVSVYTAKSGKEFWIVTEPTRYVTTVQLPEDN